MKQGPVRVCVFGKTDLGRTREHNEDTFLVADLSTGNASLQPEVRRHEVGPRGSLFMVADGMGGAAAGELASAMAADLIYRHMATAWASDPANAPDQFAYRMREAVELANSRDLLVCAGASRSARHGNHGDGRRGVRRRSLPHSDRRQPCISRPRTEAIQLTKDQSLMQRLVDAGELTRGRGRAERAAQHHPPGARTGSPRQGGSHPPASPAGRHADPLL